MKSQAIRVKPAVRLGCKPNCRINSWLLALSSYYAHKPALTDQWLTFMPYAVIKPNGKTGRPQKRIISLQNLTTSDTNQYHDCFDVVLPQ